MRNFVFVLDAVLLHRIGNILASVDALFFVSISKLLRARGADARTEDSESPSRRIESASANV